MTPITDRPGAGAGKPGRQTPRPQARAARPGVRTGRRPGRSDTRAQIIEAARSLFAERGYRAATMREIAREAGVDPGLIQHYFTSKGGLYAAAVAGALDPARILDRIHALPHGSRGERLVRAFLELWEDEHTRAPMIAMVRPAVAGDDTDGRLAEVVASEVVEPLIAPLRLDRPRLRAALIATQLLGVALGRYVLNTEPVASADLDVVVSLTEPGVAALLSPRPASLPPQSSQI